MSSSRETSWSLPLSICLELDADQQDFIRDLIYEFEQRTKRTARATLSARGDTTSTCTATPPKESPRGPGDGGYIKPSPTTTSESAVLPSDRPLSMFPPALPGTPKSERSSTGRHSDDVDYMSMNGAKQQTAM